MLLCSARLVPVRVRLLKSPQIPAHRLQIGPRKEAKLLFSQRWVCRQVWYVSTSETTLESANNSTLRWITRRLPTISYL